MAKVKDIKRFRAPLDDEDKNTSIQRYISTFQRNLLRKLTIQTQFEEVFKLLHVEYKTFKNTDNTVEEIRCCDRVIGLIYYSRTELNHQEIICINLLEDVVKDLKRHIQKLTRF